jgi:hypothetical protein
MTDDVSKLLEMYSAEEEAAGDDFFVGLGRGKLAEKYAGPESHAEQLCLAMADEVSIPIKYDLQRFESEHIEFEDDMYEALFVKAKTHAYSIFDYLGIKSILVGGVCSEDDLILEDSDFYLIESLKNLNRDYYAIYNLAELYAFLEMGITEVKFLQRDDCPICRAVDGTIFKVTDVLNAVCSGSGVTHKHCDCEFFPVVYRDRSYGPLDAKLVVTETVEIGDYVKTVHNIPVEMRQELLDCVRKLPYDVVEFVDIRTYLIDNNIEDAAGVLVYKSEEDILFVHNSYVEDKSPIDFLEALLLPESRANKVSPADAEGRQLLYYKGSKVFELHNKYWSLETGEEVK